MPADERAEQPFAAPLAVGPGRVEEIAASGDCGVERVRRLLVVGAGPPAHAPHPVADFGHRPPEPAKGTRAHPDLGRHPITRPRETAHETAGWPPRTGLTIGTVTRGEWLTALEPTSSICNRLQGQKTRGSRWSPERMEGRGRTWPMADRCCCS